MDTNKLKFVIMLQLNKIIFFKTKVPTRNKKYILNLVFRTCLTLLLILSSAAFSPDSAVALLRQHHDAPDVLRYHSQVSIKDDSGYSWQVVLFKLFPPGKPVDFNLRLVGFPGVFELAHPQALEIINNQGKLLSADDVYAEKSPAPNVGDYKFRDILLKLKTTDSLKLYVPLSNDQRLVLNIPSSVVLEWQWLVTDFN